MRKKKIIGALLATTVMSAAILGGCSQVTPNYSADMAQVIAEVNVSKAAALDDELKSYAEAVGTSKVIKRDLIVYFISAGSNYINNYGWTYEQTFTKLVNDLTDNGVLVQYATLYLLKEKSKENGNSEQKVIETYTGIEKDSVLETQIAQYEYLLGENSDDVNIAKYTLMSSINKIIDGYEREDDNSSSSGTETRTTPTGVDTQKEDYYPVKVVDGKNTVDYNIYTGYEGYLLGQSGQYYENKDYVENTSRVSRIDAYIEFLKSLKSLSYNLVDTDKENTRDVWSLTYVLDEYCSQLEQRILNKYYDLYEEQQEDKIKGLVADSYSNYLDEQKDNYRTESGISSALGEMSDSNFILYAPDTSSEGKYGFVYNILLPFSASQNAQLKALQTLYKDDELDGGYKPEYYVERKKLLKNIKTTDQRSAWFNGETEYAFDAGAKENNNYYGNSNWLFFENNVKNTGRYEPIEKYAGKYAYNGSVVKQDDDYVLTPNKLDINQMLDEFVNYVNFVTGKTNGVSKTENQAYKDFNGSNLYKTDETDKINYNNFVYASGQVSFENNGEVYNRANYLNKNTDNYKALSAVNELQYAYTTDTSVLSQFVGYSVEAGETSYVKEFEFAAKQAIDSGAGSWAVCAADYGWHLIYVTYTFDNNGVEQYNPDWNKINDEGTFENLFYEMTKSTNMPNISTNRSTKIIAEFKSDSTVTTYQSRYQDLLDMKTAE